MTSRGILLKDHWVVYIFTWPSSSTVRALKTSRTSPLKMEEWENGKEFSGKTMLWHVPKAVTSLALKKLINYEHHGQSIM